MQYTLILTSRMLTLVGICFLMLFVLLFLLGVEIGKKWVLPEIDSANAVRVNAAPTPTPTPMSVIGREALVDSVNKLTNKNAQ